MKLLTKKLRAQLPGIHETDNLSLEEQVAVVKFFTPWTSWTWYAVEFDSEDTFFGWVHGLEKEWGNFSLRELSEIRGPGGLRVERDLYFKPTRIKDLG